MVLPHDDQGDGPVILLLHAGIADRRMWADQLKPLAGAGYRVIAVDLPGFGEAPLPLEDSPWIDVIETLDWLGVERFAVVGNSIGGWVAMRVAAAAPARVWALALISSPDDSPELSPELRAAWEAEKAALELEDIDAAVQVVLDTWTLPDAPARLRLSIAKMQRRAWELQAQDGELPVGQDPLELDPGALGLLEAPTLVAYGEHDMSDFHLSAERIAASIPGAQLSLITRAGHLAPMETPQPFRDLLLDFLATPAGQEAVG